MGRESSLVYCRSARRFIINDLHKNNYQWGNDPNQFLDSYLGEGMHGIWTNETSVELDGIEIKKSEILPGRGRARKGDEKEKLFYVPAQRVITMSPGFPVNFGGFPISDPYVLKAFSERIRVLMERESISGGGKRGNVFPRSQRIREPLRKMIDSSIFFGAKVGIDKTRATKRFLLSVEKSNLPFMNWSAGQKEFMPLLLSLYHLIPSKRISIRDSLKWVVIEEPEMGLHPEAIKTVLVICMELISRGYKLVVSTHSPVLLELAWTMNFIKNAKGSPDDLFELFTMKKDDPTRKIFEVIVSDKEFKTYYFERGNEGINIKDISTLDAANEDSSIAEWGGLTSFATKASDIVSRLAANEEQI